jgi:hypothetical protein
LIRVQPEENQHPSDGIGAAWQTVEAAVCHLATLDQNRTLEAPPPKIRVSPVDRPTAITG